MQEEALAVGAHVSRNERRRHERQARWLYAVVVSMLFMTAMTWVGAIVDHPLDNAIMTGMTSSECARIGRIPPGSVLFAAPPDDDICRSYFLYRATDQNAASDIVPTQT
jgi:hypothetical protein